MLSSLARRKQQRSAPPAARKAPRTALASGRAPPSAPSGRRLRPHDPRGSAPPSASREACRHDAHRTPDAQARGQGTRCRFLEDGIKTCPRSRRKASPQLRLVARSINRHALPSASPSARPRSSRHRTRARWGGGVGVGAPGPIHLPDAYSMSEISAASRIATSKKPMSNSMIRSANCRRLSPLLDFRNSKSTHTAAATGPAARSRCPGRIHQQRISPGPCL